MYKLEDYSDEDLKTAVNPFTVNLKIPANERPTGRKHRSREGEIIYDTYLVETTPHTRFIRTTANNDKLYALSDAAMWLFIYLMGNLQQGKDYVQINIHHYKKKLGVSSDNTFIKAKKELIARGFIATTGLYKTVFWINPQIIFPGNRITKFEDNLEVKAYTP